MTAVPTFSGASRTLFVDPLLVAESADPLPELAAVYDETRDLTVLKDGTPLVEATVFAGTGTTTKAAGEHEDEDHAADSYGTLGTLTSTAVVGEREDDDHTFAWGSTELDTRKMPADVERD
jgi:putative ATP-grasp target RiPP